VKSLNSLVQACCLFVILQSMPPVRVSSDAVLLECEPISASAISEKCVAISGAFSAKLLNLLAPFSQCIPSMLSNSKGATSVTADKGFSVCAAQLLKSLQSKAWSKHFDQLAMYVGCASMRA
jgi:hypothetical protein